MGPEDGRVCDFSSTWCRSGRGTRAPAPCWISRGPRTAWPAGLVCLKGGDLGSETDDFARTFPEAAVTLAPLTDVLGTEWADKDIVPVAD